MLFCEFQRGTGCKDNEYNHKVYRDLEVMYMNSDMSKDDIYEYGKKLVDNSKSDAEIEIERKIKQEIEWYKEIIDREKAALEFYKHVENKLMVKVQRDRIREYKNKIKALRWVIA